jgi:hypothetical protein
MDLTPLVVNPKLDVQAFIQEKITNFAQDVADRLKRMD